MRISPIKNLLSLTVFLGLVLTPFPSICQSSQIDENGFVMINGLEQWITIKGERSKSVVLFLHGGPGSTLSPYSDALFSGWEKDFILVQWDQRGAGKTFGRTAPAQLTPDYLRSHPLTVADMVDDGIAVAEYLIKHLATPRIILFGTSWGSVLGIQMAAKRPDLFKAYIGHSQLVYPANDLKLPYQKVFQLAQEADDQKTLSVLDSIGTPPYGDARHTGLFLRLIKKYEQLNSTSVTEEMMKIAAEYQNEADSQHRFDGDDYSFVHFAGDKRFGVQPMSRPSNGFNFGIPIYLIQGEEDIMTPKEISRPYFDLITAPEKEFILLPKTAHGFNRAVLTTLYTICIKIK